MTNAVRCEPHISTFPDCTNSLEVHVAWLSSCYLVGLKEPVTRMSSGMRAVEAGLGRAVQRYQASVDDFDHELARLLGLNRTNLRCLDILLDAGEGAPSLLAAQLGMTSGSVTAMLDRLQALGYLTRSPHPTDRRKTVVRATPEAARRAFDLITPLLEDGQREVLTRYSDEQLEIITDFLIRNSELQKRHVQRLRAVPAPGKDRPMGTAL